MRRKKGEVIKMANANATLLKTREFHLTILITI